MIKTILTFLAAILIIACTIGVSHKIIVNSYGDDADSTKSRVNTININNYPVDTTDIKKAPKPKK